MIGFMVLLLTIPTEVWLLPDTALGLFSKQHVALSDDGHFFLLDTVRAEILHYDSKGNKLPEIATRGQAPGQLSRPEALSFHNGKLYVYEQSRISVFSGGGSFEKTVRPPHHLQFIRRVNKGWVALSGLHYDQAMAGLPVELHFFDLKFENDNILHQWSGEYARVGPDPSFTVVDGPTKFNPVRDISFLKTSKNTRYVYVAPAGLDQVFIFNMNHPSLERVIHVKGQSIPFDKKWGALFFKNSTLIPDFPEYFPKIRGVAPTQDNRLIIDKWSTPLTPPTHKYLSFKTNRYDLFSTNGEPLEESSQEYLYHSRVIAYRKPHAFVIYYVEEEEEYTIARCLIRELASFCEKHPIENPFMKRARLK